MIRNQETVASFGELFDKKDTGCNIEVVENGVVVKKKEDFEYAYLMPEHAHKFNDPRNHKYKIHECKVSKDGKSVIRKNKKIKLVSKDNIKQELKDWKTLVKKLRKENPDETVKLTDLIKEHRKLHKDSS